MDTIFIKKIRDRWRVWLGSQLDTDPQPAKCDARFYQFDDANVYAKDWSKKSYIHRVTLLEEVGENVCG